MNSFFVCYLSFSSFNSGIHDVAVGCMPRSIVPRIRSAPNEPGTSG